MGRTGLWPLYCTLLLCVHAFALDPSAIANRNLPAMVVTETRRAADGVTRQGSGCVVDVGGYVLVTHHQVKDADRVTIRLGDGRATEADVVDRRPELDLALLRSVTALPAEVRLGRGASLVMGSPLLAIASPRGLEFSAVRGIVSSMQREYEGRPLIQTDLPAAEGSSGGAVFDGDGDLIGLIVAKFRDVEGANFIQPIETAFPMLAEHGVALPPDAMGAEGPEELIPAAGIARKDLEAVEAYNDGVTAAEPGAKAESYAKAVGLLPEFFEAWYNLGVSRAALEDVDGAIDAYEHGRALDGESVPIQRNLGLLYLGQGDYEKAVASFERAIALEPERPSHYNDLGEAYRKWGKLDDAVGYYAKALGLRPDYSAAHYNLALAYAANGEATKAVEHFNDYLSMAPQAADAGQVRAWIAELTNDAAKGKTP